MPTTTNLGLTTSFLPQTASPTTSAPTPSSTWKSHAPHGYVGAIVGGVLGGVAVLMVLGMWLLIRRHRKKQHEVLAKSVSFATTEGTGTMGMRTPCVKREDGSAMTSRLPSGTSTPRPAPVSKDAMTSVQWKDDIRGPVPTQAVGTPRRGSMEIQAAP